MSANPYHLAERGEGVGALTAAEVEAGLATGRLSASTLSWREGESAWIVLAARPEFASAIRAYRTLVPPPALAFEAAPMLRLDWTAWARTLRAVWGSPRKAFHPSGPAPGLGRAVWWVLVCAMLSAPFIYVSLVCLGEASAEFTAERILARMLEHERGASAAPAGLDLSRGAAFLVGFPLAMLALTAGGACLLHAMLRWVGGGREGLRATVRSVAYVAGAMNMAAVLPCAWPLVPFTTAAYLWVALRTAHRDAAWKPLFALSVAAFCSACAATIFIALAVWPFFRPMG